MALSVKSLHPSALEIVVEGKLTSEDYKKFTPLAEERITKYGELSLLIRVADFTGWSAGALWPDLNFNTKHYSHVSRMALVEKDPSKEWMATISSPFISSDVRYFPESRLEDAREWIKGENLDHERLTSA